MRTNQPDRRPTPARTSPTGPRGRATITARLLLLLRILAVVALATASSLVASGPAQAATAHASQFSPYIAPQAWDFYGCKIYAGPAYDNLHSPYHHIGAGQVRCSSFRQVAITVRQYRSANGVVQEVGGYGFFGTHSVSSVWVPTGPACKGGVAGAYFQTMVNVTIDGYSSGWLASNWQRNVQQGCLY